MCCGDGGTFALDKFLGLPAQDAQDEKCRICSCDENNHRIEVMCTNNSVPIVLQLKHLVELIILHILMVSCFIILEASLLYKKRWNKTVILLSFLPCSFR